MNSFKYIQSTLQHKDLALYAEDLGYKSIQKGVDSLNKFLKTKNLSNWLYSGFYDFKYTSLAFYTTLAKIFDITDEKLSEDIQNAELYKKEYDSFANCYIFVNTNFKRKNEPIFILSIVESTRRLVLKRENLIFRSDEEILKKVSKMIKRHYRLKEGRLNIWGDIQNYQYHHRDGKTYLFDVNGNHLTSKEVYESLATIRLR
jgi:hypothetical protein